MVKDDFANLPFLVMELMDSMQTGHVMVETDGLGEGTGGQGWLTEFMMEEARGDMIGDSVRSMVSTMDLGLGVIWLLLASTPLSFSLNAAPIGETG